MLLMGPGEEEEREKEDFWVPLMLLPRCFLPIRGDEAKVTEGSSWDTELIASRSPRAASRLLWLIFSVFSACSYCRERERERERVACQ